MKQSTVGAQKHPLPFICKYLKEGGRFLCSKSKTRKCCASFYILVNDKFSTVCINNNHFCYRSFGSRLDYIVILTRLYTYIYQFYSKSLIIKPVVRGYDGSRKIKLPLKILISLNHFLCKLTEFFNLSVNSILKT